VLLRRHEFDLDEVEVSRASSGAFERLPLVRFSREDPVLEDLRRRGVRIYGALARVRRPVDVARFDLPAAIAVGGEKRGLSSAVRERCDVFVRIPTRAEPASLSTGHAAAILLAEAARQRRAAAAARDSG
jgi:tRNA G18 (ribose-2'-O)-methylase SpoU